MTADMKRTGRLGVAGYVALLAALRDGPSTIPVMADRHRLSTAAAYRFVATFHRLGCLHICAWRSGPGASYPVYAYGRGQDAPAPANAAPFTKARIMAEGIPLAKALECLEGLSSKRDVMEWSGMSHTLAKIALGACIEHGLIYIADWHARTPTGHGEPLPQYRLGAGPSVPKPSRERRRLVNKRYYDKVRARLHQERVLSALSANSSVFNVARSA